MNDALVKKGQATNLTNVLEALEALFCFDAWSHMDKFWKLSQQTDYTMEAQKFLSQMLTMVHDCLPRQKGNGWKLPTFHNTMHIVSDMCKYGKPKEANMEVGEKNHKVFTKCIGQHCCRQHKIFSNQVAVRLSDSFVIEKLASAMHLLHEDEDEGVDTLEKFANDKYQESTNGATYCSLC
jgi:hypothetical protein